jgi:hypothetical protein
MPKDPLGIPNISRSSALGPTGQAPDLESLLQGTSFGQTLAQAQAAGQGIQAIQGQEAPSILQRLLSPSSLPLIAAIIAGTAGAGGRGGLAVGLGGLQGLQGIAAQEEEAKAEAVQALQKERNEALDRADKSMNRVTQLVTSNPDLFVDPETGEQRIDETLLGILATGQPIRLSTTARRQLSRSDAQQGQRHDVLMEALKDAITVEDTRTVVRAIFNNMDWANVPTEVVDSVSRNIGTPELDSTLLNLIIKHGGSSGLQAIISARERGVGLEDPGVLRMIDWQEQEAGSLTPSQQENLKVLELDMELNAWSTNPENRQRLAEIRAETGEDETAFQATVVEEVFAGRSGDRNLYIQERGHLARDNTFRAYMTAWAESGDLFSLADVIAGANPAFQEMDQEAKVRYRSGLAFKAFQGMLDSVNEANAFDDAQSLNNATRRFLAEVPNMDAGRAQRLAREAITDATDQTGRVDAELFERILVTIIEQHLQKVE